MNNKYITEQKYKYIIIPEKRMVICECTTKLNWWSLKNNAYSTIPANWDKNVESLFKNSNYPEFTIRAVAKAHPDDIFDEIKGKRIAKSKANIKVYHKIKVCLREMVKSVRNIEKNFIEHYYDMVNLSIKEFDHLDNLKK